MRSKIYALRGERAQQAACLAKEVGSAGVEVTAWRILCEIELSLGDAQAAQQAIEQAQASLVDVRRPPGTRSCGNSVGLHPSSPRRVSAGRTVLYPSANDLSGLGG